MGRWVFDLAFFHEGPWGVGFSNFCIFHEAPWGFGFPTLVISQFCTSSMRPHGGIKRMRAPEKEQGKNDQLPESRGLARRRLRKEQQAKDDELLESNKLARRQASEEQRVKDDQLLESYRLAKLQDAERRRELRLQQDEGRRKAKQARDDSAMGALLRHEASMETWKRQDIQLRGVALREQAHSRDAERVARVNERRALQSLQDDHRRRERDYRDNAGAQALQRHEAASKLRRHSGSQSRGGVLLPSMVSFHPS